jgi:hypothetical protein
MQEWRNEGKRESQDRVNTGSESTGNCSAEASRYISPGTAPCLLIFHFLRNMAVRLAAAVLIVVAVVLPGVLCKKIRKCFS